MKEDVKYWSLSLTDKIKFIGRRYIYFNIYITNLFDFECRLNNDNYYYDGYHNNIQFGFIGIDWN